MKFLFQFFQNAVYPACPLLHPLRADLDFGEFISLMSRILPTNEEGLCNMYAPWHPTTAECCGTLTVSLRPDDDDEGDEGEDAWGSMGWAWSSLFDNEHEGNWAPALGGGPKLAAEYLVAWCWSPPDTNDRTKEPDKGALRYLFGPAWFEEVPEVVCGRGGRERHHDDPVAQQRAAILELFQK